MVAMRAWFVGIQKCGYYGLGTVGAVCNNWAVSINVGHPGNPTLDSGVRKLFFFILTPLLKQFEQRKNIDLKCVNPFFPFCICRFWPMRWAIILDKVIANEPRKMVIGTGRPVSQLLLNDILH